ncbi:MAG: hypothetical protein ABIH23_11890, partial [bacterium]
MVNRVPGCRLIGFLIVVGCAQILSSGSRPFADGAPFPPVWTSYSPVKGYEEDFKDLREHGVGVVDINPGPDKIPELLSAARRYDMKILISIPEITEQAYAIPNVERAVMIGGAYQGKAIDRFRFSFAPKQHEIIIDNPYYDKEDCYDKLGRYLPGMRDPIRAEVVVKLADYDGEQHLQIIPATTSRLDDKRCSMRFDLTGVEGDLDHVILAVYWISEGTRDYWMFGDSASANAASTKKALADAVRKQIGKWQKANDGSFPADIIAIRFGDECFHVSCHLNSLDCSYPMWDYSESAVAAYRERNPGEEYPRGKSWIDVFGRRAYAHWMYTHHRACADLVRVVKETLREEGVEHLLVYRNITRGNVFDSRNDHDGTGLEMLVQELDIAHLDPYPVAADKYLPARIPEDMSYVSGLARRHKKYLVPWLQAHSYWGKRGGLTHPGPEYIARMVQEHIPHQPDALMWLGYGKSSTFPNTRPESWEEAGRQHKIFMELKREPIEAKLAAIRSYTVRSLRDVDGIAPQDASFTDAILYDVVMRQHWPYDPFEPFQCSELDINSLKEYPLVLAEMGS